MSGLYFVVGLSIQNGGLVLVFGHQSSSSIGGACMGVGVEKWS